MEFLFDGRRMEDLRFDKENICRIVSMAYYDGCVFALCMANVDTFPDTREWLKEEAEKYAELRYKDMANFG